MLRLFGLLALVVCTACERPVAQSGSHLLVFKHQPFWGDPRPFREVLARFEREHPGVKVRTEALPNSSDVAHQFFLTALEGGAQDFDLLIADVVWAPEFARAGWIADLSDEFPPEQLRQTFLPGPSEAVILDGKTYAVPWYVDVGLLYYRKDLVPRAPRTYDELRAFAQAAMKQDPRMQGYVWQGKQYEGLVCNVYEAIWGHGGQSMQDGRVLVTSAPAVAALGFLRSLLKEGLSPPSVTSAAEEESRHVFQAGRAVFMRNWPYAWLEAEKDDSPLKGKVGFAPLPTVSGEPGSGTLGGWQLAVNAHSPPEKRKLAAKLIRYLTERETTVEFAVTYGRNPPRPDAYQDPRLRTEAPFIAELLPALERARPRPVTPYYTLFSDVLQGEFSAAIAGMRSPEAALGRAQQHVDRLMGMSK